MCQQGEAEIRAFRSMELSEIQEVWRKHESGEKPLTDEQIKELVVRKFMLLEN